MDYQEFTRGGHSYRGYTPEMVEELLADTDRDTALSGVEFIESGRWADALEATSEMFFKLDRDEKELFTARNPDVVEWTAVWQEVNGLDPMTEMREAAREGLLGDDRLAATGEPFFESVPKYDIADRHSFGDINNMAERRRSYREWSPYEFLNLMERETKIETTLGMMVELGIYPPEVYEEESPGTTIEAAPRDISRGLLHRVEDHRFDDMLKAWHNAYAPLDPDERKMFSRRNPGLIMWLSAYGKGHHLIWGEQLTPHEWPTIDRL